MCAQSLNFSAFLIPLCVVCLRLKNLSANYFLHNYGVKYSVSVEICSAAGVGSNMFRYWIIFRDI
jgi:glucan phosphoethanolaminetransferase (alkaline phosphatase superfamily)